MTETARRPGEIIVPRLRWARRTEGADPRSSHLSVAFDVFMPNLEVRPEADLAKPRPIHAYGLVNVIERRVDLQGDLEWLAYAPPALDGGRAPENRSATDRFLRLSTAIARATAHALGGGPEDWPVVATRLPIDSRVWIDRLHDRCDWVVTIDRNACIEYFDAPRQLPDIYERFVIDAVPERADLGAFQLITTTKNLDEVRDLVDEALGDMGLSSSERNSRFLLNQVKALSGRLAMRLANPGVGTGELIALALMRACCVDATDTSGAWLDLSSGFLVPVDEIADRAPVKVALGRNTEANGRRADFIHVKAPSGRGPIEFRFVEVKHRLHLRTVRQPDLLQDILNQTGDLRRRWHAYFFDLTLKPIERALRSSRLGVLLQFYADRALRHGLSSEAHARLRREIDALVLKEDYRPAELEKADIGYVFCPEHRIGRPERLYTAGGESAEMWLFGPTLLPDERPPATRTSGGRAAEIAEQRALMTPDAPTTDECEPPVIEPHTQPDDATAQPSPASAPSARTEVDVMLGTAAAGSDTVSWRLSIRANPHLMIVGLPGMGKTTCLINICRQLAAARIAPIVFSYHDDIDVSLAEAVGPLDFVDYNGLGFNPLRIDSEQATAHVDVAGTLRDIFGSIFSDLGDLQLEELRQAIKQSFDDLGWASRPADDAARLLPPFRAFFDILRAKTKPNAGLVARLQELADYGFFDSAGERAGLLDGRRSTIVRVHTTQNEVLQNAFASFVLYSLYKDMFRRGVQTEITHARAMAETG